METYTQHPLRPIHLQCLLHRRHLILIRLFIRIHINRHIHAHLDARIPDRFEDERGLVAVCAVETEFVCQLGEKVDVAGDVGEGCAASGCGEGLVHGVRWMGEEGLTRGGGRFAVCMRMRGRNRVVVGPL